MIFFHRLLSYTYSHLPTETARKLRSFGNYTSDNELNIEPSVVQYILSGTPCIK